MSEPCSVSEDLVTRLRACRNSSNDLLFEAARHITYLRTLLKASMEYVPDVHPWMPGMQDEVKELIP